MSGSTQSLLWPIGINMLKFAQGGAARAFAKRYMTTQAVSTNTQASTVTKAGETQLLENNIWFVNNTSPAERVVGFRWTPGLWARAKEESAATNVAIWQRAKSGDVTPRDLFNLGAVGFSMWAAFIVGNMIGKWKIFGHRNQEPHHGHGFWTDTPAHH